MCVSLLYREMRVRGRVSDSRYTFSSILQPLTSSTTLSPRHDSRYRFAIAEVCQEPPRSIWSRIGCVCLVDLEKPLSTRVSIVGSKIQILSSIHSIHMDSFFSSFILHSFILCVLSFQVPFFFTHAGSGQRGSWI
jgi:hypothetical protein